MSRHYRPGTREWRELKACGLTAKDIRELDEAIDSIVDRWWAPINRVIDRVEEEKRRERARRRRHARKLRPVSASRRVPRSKKRK